MDSLSVVGNPSSVHQSGRSVRKLIEDARISVADYFGTVPSAVVFTSGATESNNLALKGFAGAIAVSAVEHDSVYTCRPDAFVCPVDNRGQLDLEQLERWAREISGPKLLSVMAANNETGIIQPLESITKIAQKYGVYTHCDAVQAVHKVPMEWAALNMDMISLSAHKIGGLQGVGALLINSKIPLTAQINGGGQERSYRAGTENLTGIVSLGAALQEQPSQWQDIRKMRDHIEIKLTESCPDMTIFGADMPRLPNTIGLTMPGVSSVLQVMNFDLKGICVSAGSACSSGKVKPSRVLQAMGISEKDRNCALRVSLGLTTTKTEVDHFVATWIDIYKRFITEGTQQG